ncbi:dipeptide ABC transporter ATP-binding protein [Natrarchaeobaculum sulfurireducens]|uniref:Nickel import system ATP-binding protein NikD n=1 Tax=Natrarchaeobaculum sulfurireducens TaxID=2044521 RepID=A0A346PTV5_9EURY|nr:ABC transporter ATP-binding protein [Natrarchaeobaculum sulfurireducens]AXR82950.1 Oligopeptide transport ATP-binding protein OppF [Natrarchaeobaculum sulfurireducens]
MSTVLTVENLHTQFETSDGTVRAVDGVSFAVDAGEVVGIVGESGSGKSVTARSILGLHEPAEIVRGSIVVDGVDITKASDRTLRRLRGETVSMAFQDPTETLNPVFDVGEQIAESVRVHRSPDSQTLLDYLHVPPFSRREKWCNARVQAIDLMEQVGIASPGDRADAYPHELSGGMRQRAMLAIALASSPDLLIADEPTTALDTTTQAQLLEMLRTLTDERDLATVLITHDLGVVADVCDRVVVMYAGEVMETGPTERILEEPRHPYTRALLACLTQRVAPKSRLPAIDGRPPDLSAKPPGCPFAPRCVHATDGCRAGGIPVLDLEDREGTVACGEPIALEGTHCSGPSHSSPAGVDGPDQPPSSPDPSAGTANSHSKEPVVRLEGVSKRYSLDDGLLDRLLGEPATLEAVGDVDLEIRSGETLGLVGESGCGKSTLASLVTGLETSSAGTIRFDGQPVGSLEDRATELLADVGVVFQNPRSSFNPRRTIERSIAEPLRQQGWGRDRCADRIAELLDRVGLSERHATNYPHELSGGQIQRAAIARAIVLEPRLVVLDEPVSALDASVKARILNLLLDLQADLELTYLLISHDLDVVAHVADRVAVLYLGTLLEVGPAARVFTEPTHPYTKALLEAIPSIDPARDGGVPLEGDVASSVDPPAGCVFHTRCPLAEADCRTEEPPLEAVGPVRSKCHFAGDVANRLGGGDVADAESKRAKPDGGRR